MNEKTGELPEYQASLEFTVRSYELDIQGVVNNAVYQNYLEHARHDFLLSRGIDFTQLHREGIELIVTKVEIEYKYPLRSHDRFVIKSLIRREGNVRLVFHQGIYRIPDNKLIVKAVITGVSTKNGKPVSPEPLIEKMQGFMSI